MKVVVKLQGGLGNQMFQYAFGKYISDKTGRRLVMDTSYLDNKDRGPNFAYRDYDLDIFNLDVDVVGQFDEPFEYIQERWDAIHEVQYDLIIQALNSTSENIYLDGYWPSPKYFNNTINCFNNFKYDIEESSKSLAEEIKNSNSVMINIRRTDFLNNDFHGTYGRPYVTKALEKIKGADLELEEIIRGISRYNKTVRNNAGGAFNHALFWKMLTPKRQKIKGEILDKIIKDFGTYEEFKKQFIEKAKTNFGSGWCWLIISKSGKLKIVTTPNQDNPLMNVVKQGGYPLLGLDVWEHAYYLKYQNRRAEYIKNWFSCINWNTVQWLMQGNEI